MNPLYFQLIILAFIVVVLYLFSFDEPLVIEHDSQWHQKIEGLSEDPETFYHRVAEELRRYNLPDVQVALASLLERRFGFARRDYLKVTRQGVIFYLFCTPYGEGTFFSWWLFSWLNRWSRYPLLSFCVRWYLRWQTLFQDDDLKMFLGTVHGAVLKVLEETMQAQGLKPLESEQRRPLMREFYRR
jgi:hypothetical protein